MFLLQSSVSTGTKLVLTFVSFLTNIFAIFSLVFAYIGECILTLRECLLGNITSALIDDKQSR